MFQTLFEYTNQTNRKTHKWQVEVIKTIPVNTRWLIPMKYFGKIKILWSKWKAYKTYI